MKNKDMIRKVLQTFAIILFIFQFQQSVRKYFQYPVVEQTSRIHVKDWPTPVVYVCQASQFNYPKALDNGYMYFTDFLLGIMMNTTRISWKGKWGNKTYTDLEDIILDSDYSSIKSDSLIRSTNLWNVNEKIKRTFLFPQGICLKIENQLQYKDIKISSTEDMNIYFVDPASANDIRTEETPNAKSRIGPTSNTLFAFRNYELEFFLYDNSIHDGTSCTDYTKTARSYRECLNDILAKEFIATYGCLPAWVSTKSKITCEEETNIDANAMRDTPLYKDISDLVRNLETDMFKRCLSPCKTMKVKLMEVSYRSNWLRESVFEARSKDWATVHTQVEIGDKY